MAALVGIHILFLHSTGSSNPVGVGGGFKTFYPY
jgi:quinol-cytochrome oxidoreductase complex cytochrome b subunit